MVTIEIQHLAFFSLSFFSLLSLSEAAPIFQTTTPGRAFFFKAAPPSWPRGQPSDPGLLTFNLRIISTLSRARVERGSRDPIASMVGLLWSTTTTTSVRDKVHSPISHTTTSSHTHTPPNSFLTQIFSLWLITNKKTRTPSPRKKRNTVENQTSQIKESKKKKKNVATDWRQ